jgi:hypothetical protein
MSHLVVLCSCRAHQGCPPFRRRFAALTRASAPIGWLLSERQRSLHKMTKPTSSESASEATIVLAHGAAELRRFVVDGTLNAERAPRYRLPTRHIAIIRRAFWSGPTRRLPRIRGGAFVWVQRQTEPGRPWRTERRNAPPSHGSVGRIRRIPYSEFASPDASRFATDTQVVPNTARLPGTRVATSRTDTVCGHGHGRPK